MTAKEIISSFGELRHMYQMGRDLTHAHLIGLPQNCNWHSDKLMVIHSSHSKLAQTAKIKLLITGKYCKNSEPAI